MEAGARLDEDRRSGDDRPLRQSQLRRVIQGSPRNPDIARGARLGSREHCDAPRAPPSGAEKAAEQIHRLPLDHDTLY